MLRVLLYLLPVLLAVYAFVDCVIDRDHTPPYAPRFIWLLAIVILPIAGPIGWLIASRMSRPPTTPRARSAFRAPDDDPDFLRGLGHPGRPGGEDSTGDKR